MTRSDGRTRRFWRIAPAALLALALAVPAAAQNSQQRLPNQQGSGLQNLQRSSDQLNQSLRNTQNQLNNRANMQGLEQRQTIQNMQRDTQRRIGEQYDLNER
tara:strand:- start:208 stop:513 length:306 start_codon:yes stop_codon:yes gene_type:complete